MLWMLLLRTGGTARRKAKQQHRAKGCAFIKQEEIFCVILCCPHRFIFFFS